MELQRFNTLGIAAFQAFLDAFDTSTPVPWPEAALSDPSLSEPVMPSVAIERRNFATRYELAEYLDSCFDSSGFRAVTADSGLWAWVACFYFNEICPTTARGVQQPGATPRWIPRSTDWRRYYRHLVAGPYGIFRAHRDNPRRAMALLCQRPGRPGDVVEQLASRQQIVTNPAIMQIATDCFINPANGQLRRRAGGKGAGSPRRLVAVLDQFDVTWDLSAMPAAELRGKLPAEFTASA